MWGLIGEAIALAVGTALGTSLIYLATQLFPKFFADLILGTLKHGQDVRIENLKHELGSERDAANSELTAALTARYGAIGSSTQLLLASQQNLSIKRIEAVQTLWTALLMLADRISRFSVLDAVLTPEEIDSEFEKLSGHTVFFEQAIPLMSASGVTNVFGDTVSEEVHRLYVGDALWQIFYITRAAHGRLLVLFQFSKDKKGYRDWRKDTAFASLIVPLIGASEFERLRDHKPNGYLSLTEALKQKFLAQAEDVFIGAHALPNAISSIHVPVRDEVERLIHAS